MATDVVMPRLSDTMTEGTVLRWMKQRGDPVSKGDALVEIETEKATLEIESEVNGVLEAILVAEGVADVGAVLGVIVAGQPGIPSPLTRSPAVEDARRAPVANLPRSSNPPPVIQPLANIRASPIARALARQSGIDLDRRQFGDGSGPGGRVVRADVERVIERSGRAGNADENVLSPERASGEDVYEPSRMQTTIARRMTEAKQLIPHYYVDMDVDMDAAMAFRRELATLVPSIDVSVNDLVVRACALALRQLPRVSVSWVDNRIVRRSEIDIGVAISLEDDGLLVGVIRNADLKSLEEIASDSRTLADRARTGKITHTELEGGTFTVSNLGMFGVSHFHAIINPPQSGILAVGAVVERPAVREGQVVVRHEMALSLSADHRVYSGATAARFLQAVRDLLEHPLRLILPQTRSGD